MMNLREFTFLSADGKTPIHCIEWKPEGEVRAVLQIAHGVAEYAMRYSGFARFLTENGIAVLANDHIGHGESMAEGATPVYFGEKDGWKFVVDDMHTLYETGRKLFPGVPYYLMGHSMGSFLARTFLIRYPSRVDGAIIMGTGQQLHIVTAGGRLTAKAESRKYGWEGFSELVDKLAFGAYNKAFAPNRTTHDWLSRNEANVDAYIADPLCGGKASLGLLYDMLGGISFICDRKNVKRMDMYTPVLFISGGDDPVGDRGKGVVSAYNSFRRAGVKDLTIQLYPGMRHEILNEKEYQTVYDFILNWLDKRIEKNEAR